MARETPSDLLCFYVLCADPPPTLPRGRRHADYDPYNPIKVQHLISRCTCPVQFSMIKVSEGKYRVGDSSTHIFVRILRNHVMVRVGGGWDTLEHYLDKHDPCRCTSMTHKHATRVATPQRMKAPHVQHEITARLAPRMGSPGQPQPALLVSRSQSPLPPVEWTALPSRGLGAGWKILPSAPPGNSSHHGGRKTPRLLVSEDPSEPRQPPSFRVQERPATPSRSLPAAGARPGPRQAVSAPGGSGRESCPAGCPCQPAGSAGSSTQGARGLPGPRCGGPADHIRGTPPSPAGAAQRPAPSGAVGQRRRGSQPPGSAQREGEGCSGGRPPTLAPGPRAPHPLPAEAQPGSLAGPQERRGGAKAPAALRPPSPGQGGNVEGCGKTPGGAGSAFGRPPTPVRCAQEASNFRNGGSALARDQAPLRGSTELRDGGREKESPIQAGSEQAPHRGSFDSCRARPSWFGRGQKMRDGRASAGPGTAPGHSWGSRPGSLGGAHAVLPEKEQVYTPPPINFAEEQALYRSLEDEILSNIRELESDSDSILGDLESDVLASGGDSPRAASLAPAFRQGTEGTLARSEAVPRSGVYVPVRAAGWHPADLHYDQVIQELSVALHREHRDKPGSPPQVNAALANGSQAPSTALEEEGACRVKSVAPEAACPEPPGATCGAPAEANGSSDASQAAPGDVSLSEGSSTPDTAGLPPDKPRRSLKKPERVPSIYKLKWWARIRPRRDHRPGKRPSKIPKPVTHRLASRKSGTQSQGRCHGAKGHAKGSVADTKQANVGIPTPERLLGCSPSSVQRGETSPWEGEMGASDQEASWV